MHVVSQGAFVGKYTDFKDMQGMDNKNVRACC
jgi:hypothetical protein